MISQDYIISLVKINCMTSYRKICHLQEKKLNYTINSIDCNNEFQSTCNLLDQKIS